ncbi:hypothetical protein Pmar_PMAR000484 [Perkinsus marinus ATCC 50983]|uniref:Uncharacterized protein n=1 Tax=Perkinsus marinus (strain ATCC 50983 / TXsc) TaxID=423536 RepID=C5L158_PERM5|nr:hypothetical protein Pmar_PMAR000484 [Perkinsus marinus ATCC 50983]EER09535.1 hypothetical protein Pmar_PMAR000484 [Perkinsus marinus ATCC 50983]|eukprot:XP_002777740.1 hypothetical protein Pmar_PMAR000484 [Perkinsus marinus ATCC 50983]
MVKRLANNIRELLDEIQLYGVEVLMKKVTGEENAEADALSRILDNMGLSGPRSEDRLAPHLSIVLDPTVLALGRPGDEARQRLAGIQAASPKFKDIINKLTVASYPDGIMVDGKLEYLKFEDGLLVALKSPHRSQCLGLAPGCLLRLHARLMIGHIGKRI